MTSPLDPPPIPPVDPAPVRPARRLLRRLPLDGRIAGVCAGLADYFDVDVTLIRLAWIVLTIFPGALIGGAVAYVAAWAIMPKGLADPSIASRRRLVRSRTDRKIAGVCGGFAAYFDLDPTLVRVGFMILSIYPGAVVVGVLVYVVAWVVMRNEAAPVLYERPSVA